VFFQNSTEYSKDFLGMSNKDSSTTLWNANGISVKILTAGAAIAEVRTPDRQGNFTNIAMSLDPVSQYLDGSSYAGAVLGPNAGRIRGSKIPVGTRIYSLAANEGENQLHGGPHNFSRSIWALEEVRKEAAAETAIFTLNVPDGLDGYPGNRKIAAAYRLDNTNALTITFRAISDRETWLNLSNHCYWNLSGDFTQSVLNHTLRINADRVAYNDPSNLPIGLYPVVLTPFDFRQERSIRENLRDSHDSGQFAAACGYNHAYDVAGKTPAAALCDPESGRSLTVETNCPALVFYSGGCLGADTTLPGGIPASPSCAVALEAQEFPDALHLEGVPHPIAEPLREWTRYIRYSFGLILASNPNTYL
jgi:aldose 1-epimerase